MIFACLMLGVSGVWASDRPQAVSDFVQAGDLYRQGRYAEAAETYEKILSAGWESGPVYFNLANSYFKSDDIGRAVLNYERAERLMPRDRDLKFNKDYLLLRRPQIIRKTESNIFESAVTRHLRFYTQDEMMMIAVGCLMILSVLWVVAYQARWRQSTWILTTVFLMSVSIVYASGCFFKADADGRKAVALRDEPANFEPREGAVEHFRLPEGSVVDVLKQEAGWSKVRRFDRKLGWIPDGSLEKLEKKF